MTSRTKILIPAAACAALFAVGFANVARAQLARECFMECNRAPDKPVTTSADSMSSGNLGARSKPMSMHHKTMTRRHKARALSSDHTSP